MRWKMAATAGAAVTLVLTTATACGGSSANAGPASGPLTFGGVQVADASLLSAARKEGSVTLYTGLHADTEQAIAKEFTKDTGVKVNIVAAKPDALVERVISEYGAKKVGADVVSVSSLAYVQELKKAKTLAAYCTPFQKNYPAEVTDPGCTYFPRNDNYITMSVNTAVLQKKGLTAPTKWTDLLDPKWKGLVGASQIAVGGSSWSFWKLMRDTYGTGYWNGMAKQKMFLSESAASTGDALERGEIAVAIESPSTPYEEIAQGAPIKVLTPEVVPVYDNYISLAAGAPHSSAGKLLMDWVASPRGQSTIGKVGGGDYPASNSASGPTISGQQLPPMSGLKTKIVDMEAESNYVSAFPGWTKQWDAIFNYS